MNTQYIKSIVSMIINTANTVPAKIWLNFAINIGCITITTNIVKELYTNKDHGFPLCSYYVDLFYFNSLEVAHLPPY